jgi:tRNA modification GTPase
MNTSHTHSDTIAAIATAPGSGAIAVIRLSGPDSLPHALTLFNQVKKPLEAPQVKSHHSYFGTLNYLDKVVDEVLMTYFKAPHSYTGEEVVEISCHGSEFIQERIMQIFLDAGVRQAQAGEFTLRAFLNGKMDLSQAEAVADLIASQSDITHRMAINQMRGGFSDQINELREKLLHFASLLELELDFSEEEVEFANREEFLALIRNITDRLSWLINSFKAGNVLKKGIPVAIIGKPNAGKSTLLNAILNEERALVSEIPGTTRDAIEDTFVVSGYSFRFVDTAGLHKSDDHVENMGMARTYDKMKQASIILYVCDISTMNEADMDVMLEEFKDYIQDENKHFILVANKIDQMSQLPPHLREIFDLDTVFISAKRKENIHELTEKLVSIVRQTSLTSDVMVNNSRHYEALIRALNALQAAEKGFAEQVPSDLIAIDVRQALYHLGTITGAITTDEILGSIFSKFCIGK